MISMGHRLRFGSFDTGCDGGIVPKEGYVSRWKHRWKIVEIVFSGKVYG